MPAAQTYEPIQTTTLGSAQNTVTFSSISQTYTDIILVCAGLIVQATDAIDIRMGNGSLDTANNYDMLQMLGNGAGNAQTYYQSGTSITNAGIVTTGTNQSTIIEFFNYTDTGKYKNVICRSNVTDSGFSRIALTSGTWRSTQAINTISLRCDNASYQFTTGSTFTMYGIKAA